MRVYYSVAFITIFVFASNYMGFAATPERRVISGEEATTMIIKGIELKDLSVRGDIVIDGQTITKPVIFEGCIIYGNFKVSSLKNNEKVIFNQQFSIHKTTFYGTVMLSADFREHLQILDSTFNNILLLKESFISKDIFIDNNKFNEDVVIETKSPESILLINSSVFHKNVIITDSNFSKVSIHSEFDNSIHLNKVNTKFIDLSRSVFNGRVVLTDSTFDGLSINNVSLIKELTSIHWNDVKNRLYVGGGSESKYIHGRKTDSSYFTNYKSIEVMRQYLLLNGIFKANGQFDDADAALYKYNHLNRELMKWSVKKVFSYFIDWTCGYCTMPFRIFNWVIGFILGSAFFYTFPGAIKQNNGLSDEDIGCFNRFRNAIYFSVNTFTTVGTGDYFPVSKTARFVAMMEVLFGYVIMGLFLVTMTSQIIR